MCYIQVNNTNLAYFQYINNKEEIEKTSEAASTKLGFDQHPYLIRVGIPCHSTPGVPVGKMAKVRAQSRMSLLGETSKVPVWVSIYNPRMQADIIINQGANCNSGFLLMLFVLSCKLECC